MVRRGVVDRVGPVALVGLLALSAGCTGTVSEPGGDDGDDGDEVCVDDQNRAPAAPAVSAPAPDRLDVLPDKLTIQTSAFSDPDAGDAHLASEFEIWLTAGGEPVLRVWRAETSEPDQLTRVSLTDGVFEVGDGALDQWADYQVVARYRDSAECSAWSEWSAPRRFRTDDGSTFWFGSGSGASGAAAIRDVRIEIPQASWDLINAQAVPPGCVPFLREYYPGSVELDGERFDGIGVRTKGGCGSARTLDGKASFKINLSWNDPAEPGCPAERRSHGLKRLTLNNMVQDRSYVHERLAYRFYQLMGVPTPRANHARVFVNGELWGLYANVETIDRRFLSRWFDSNDGMLYEGTYSCDLVPQNVPPGEEDTFCLSRKFHPNECEPPAEGGDPEDYSPLREMVQALAGLADGAFYPEVEAIFDFDTFLSMWAVETIIGHWDGYTIQIINNYRVYHDPSTDRWTIIPTGVDQTFEQSTGIGTTAGLLARRCWQEPDCQAAFLARVAEATTVFEQANLAALAETIRTTIDPHVAEDPRKEGTYEQFQTQVTQTLDFLARRAAEIGDTLPP
jgi:CotH kinase protein